MLRLALALAGCHPACNVGCLRVNDITACTTSYYGGRYRDCDRCTTGFRELNNQQFLGCERGAKTDHSCLSPSFSPSQTPTPTPTPTPSPSCAVQPVTCGMRRLTAAESGTAAERRLCRRRRRLLDRPHPATNNHTNASDLSHHDESQSLEATTARLRSGARALQASTGVCTCDGMGVIVFDACAFGGAGCYYRADCSDGCTPATESSTDC